MIVPDFKLKQTQNHIQVYIRLPYIKVNSSQFYIQDNTFKFYLKPYLLSLKFMQSLKTVQSPSKATYYHQKYILECHLQKNTPGQHFQNLQLMTSILNKKQAKKSNKVKIQVINNENKQKVIIQQSNITDGYGYGFNLNFQNQLNDLQQQRYQLFAFDPKTTSYSNRFLLSQSIISKKFNIQSYLFDKYDNQQQINCIIKSKQIYVYLDQLIGKQKDIFNNKYQQKIKQLKSSNKQILINIYFKTNIIKQIFSIVYSYMYQLIVMNGQFGPQSSKTINLTSIILNANYLYTKNITYKQIVANCYRRCLTYSLYKHIKICQLATKITVKYFNKDCIKCILCDLSLMFQKSQPRYLLNKLYINDYLMYIQEIDIDIDIKECISEVEGITIKEDQLGFKIKEYQDGQMQQYDQDQSQQKQQDSRLMEQYDQLIKQMEDLQTLD